MYNVAIIGAAGFTGAEAVRLLLSHPEFALLAASSDSEAGKPLAQVYPAFYGRTELAYVRHEAVLSEHASGLDLVLLAIPHTQALQLVPQLLSAGVSVIDLSADFRLNDAAVYENWYGVAHTAPDLLASAVYGLPEVYRRELAACAQRRAESGEAALVANPGCYPTASVLAALPVVSTGLMDADEVVVVNAISGVSGAGKKPTETTQFCLANENLNAYGVTTHRHTPEIAQTLSHLAGHVVSLQFTPHLAPLNRGMVATVAMRLSKAAAAETNAETIQQLYEEAFAGEPFVQVLPQGSMPRSSSVKFSNSAHIGVACDVSTRMVVASCAIDNLGKGAASQAIQCANILFSLDEKTGLAHEGGLL
ncbi:MAG: N-acetyl-gamma-glutamyl-phosphate reductase [Coriobacteriales bacterium]|nr:N-acetyl-gamma-glutamyl-phosphate reductase [Coriobacteriales bacterium]